jgi:hypothetical protein
MFTAHLVPTPEEPLPYCVVVRRDGVVVRLQPAGSVREAARVLSKLLREAREYEDELRAEVERDG